MKLYREATKVMPRISFSNGKMSIVGRSIPVDNQGICEMFYDYVVRYMQFPDAVTEIIIDLDYVNCNTQRCLARTFGKLNELYRSDYQVIVNWFYATDDESMLELGSILQSLVQFPFCFIEKDRDTKNPESKLSGFTI
ncbi:MAG: DUF1987 domain-containing protein [Bacteroidetes bacterium]|nr:DUF1987 domain-containing protein [Bacteroidota bacterium]